MPDSSMALLDIPVDDLPNRDVACSSKLRAVTVRSVEELDPHFDAWNRLAWDAPQKIPSLMPGWVRAYLRQCLGQNESWICSFVYSGSRLLGVLPIIILPHPILGPRRPVLRTLSDEFTPSGDILLAPDHAAEAFQALVGEVRREVPAHLGLSVPGVRQGAPLWKALESGVDGYVRLSGARSRYSFLKVDGSLENYLAGLGHMRRNLKRFRKKLETQGPVSVQIIKGSPQAEDFLADFIALEASGWKGRNGTAMAGNPKAVAFYSELARNLGVQQNFEWHVVRVKEDIVAAQLCIRCGGSLMLAKIAFNETYADCRPGHLLTGEVLKTAFSHPDIVEVNHLSNADSEGYWRMSYDEYADVHLVRRSMLPLLFRLPHALVEFAYQNYARPWIPTRVKKAYRAFRRRGDRKPLRSAVSRSVRSTERSAEEEE
jgi:CelD/BcsL family acetyltransferase involved in cellulose biosynthesis